MGSPHPSLAHGRNICCLQTTAAFALKAGARNTREHPVRQVDPYVTTSLLNKDDQVSKYRGPLKTYLSNGWYLTAALKWRDNVQRIQNRRMNMTNRDTRNFPAHTDQLDHHMCLISQEAFHPFSPVACQGGVILLPSKRYA